MARIEGTYGWLLLLLLAVVYPFVAGNSYHLTVMTMAFILAIATLGLNLITGCTGQFNLAHAGFMAIGAYTVGILTVDYGVPFWIAFLLSGVVSAVIGLLIGVLCLRLKGHYFSIFTLCVGYIIFLFIEKSDSITHGTVGIMGIPAPPGIGSFDFDTPMSMYYLALAFLVVGVWLMRRLVASIIGRSFTAVRNSDALAEALGINLMRTKILSFVLSVFYAGFAGGLYAGHVRFLGPDMAYVTHTFDMVMFMLIGGIGTVLGPVLGALIVPWITQYLQFLQDYRMVVFGPLLILLLIFVPDGIVGTYRKRRARKLAAQAAAKNRQSSQVGVKEAQNHA
ncbi:branched-chain amino acid ABC transporter permease [Verticiella sediminum]|uniref:Branched-chain amino acid ABC transporter permease n=1 Tax=Verticiella sediminum TaxID=1247510 RepID=A0A556ADR5_9BURK|nr:branched-chain amino acid ABC transporter permease [Verticiella sediminum]TSH91020.1 branched-chain amino acid ABC transporter permease [Verticiella sediminum]